MTGPSDSGSGEIRVPPQELENNPSLWDSVILAAFGGATRTEQVALEQSLYKGFSDPSVSKGERLRARDDAIRGLGYFGVQFDWDAWRREMGYSA
jgi:hypothetical protein